MERLSYRCLALSAALIPTPSHWASPFCLTNARTPTSSFSFLLSEIQELSYGIRQAAITKMGQEIPSWLSGDESDQHPWGRSFDPWPCSVGWGSRVAVSCGVGVGCRRSLDPALLWLWRILAATALIRPLAWEPSYAAGTALEKVKRQKKKKNYQNLWGQGKPWHYLCSESTLPSIRPAHLG